MTLSREAEEPLKLMKSSPNIAFLVKPRVNSGMGYISALILRCK